MKVGIACDKWKVPIFERILEKRGFEFETVGNSIAPLITVVTDDLEKLTKAVAEANGKCRMKPKGSA